MIAFNDLVDTLKLEVLVAPKKSSFTVPGSEINRPGLQLTGFWEYFAFNRPQIIGRVEATYLRSLTPGVRALRLKEFCAYDIPFILICRGINDLDDLVETARASDVPVFRSQQPSTKIVVTLISYLTQRLAPRTSMHGVLVDVYGVGILITGESGVGKSEAALELVKRGHPLVADDVVEIRRVSERKLVGEAPEMIRHFMEIRGVGVIDIATMYGIGAVLRSTAIDMVVHLEHWVQGKEYDRLGLEDEYMSILDVNVPRLVLPVRPGRNLAIVLEVAARNLRLKEQGYNAARELDKRFTERLRRSAEENDNAENEQEDQ